MGRAEDLYERIIAGGETAIDEFIESQQSEELFLDFKTVKTKGDDRKLHDHDLNNLATAISGFGNSEGGVIVWGVECSKGKDNSDLPDNKHPIKNVHKFKSMLEGAISGRTIPPHTKVLNYPIPNDSDNNGFVVTLIPKSMQAPHQTVGKLKYYIRAGSSFVPTPHDVLSGLFGKRPQPKLCQMFSKKPIILGDGEIKFEVGFVIKNEGPGIASDVFMTIMLASGLHPNFDLFFDSPDGTTFTETSTFAQQKCLMSNVEYRLPPTAWCQPTVLQVTLKPPILESLKINVAIGCAGAEPIYNIIENDKNTMNELCKKIILKDRYGISVEESYTFVKKFLNIEKYERE